MTIWSKSGRNIGDVAQLATPTGSGGLIAATREKGSGSIRCKIFGTAEREPLREAGVLFGMWDTGRVRTGRGLFKQRKTVK